MLLTLTFKQSKINQSSHRNQFSSFVSLTQFIYYNATQNQFHQELINILK